MYMYMYRHRYRHRYMYMYMELLGFDPSRFLLLMGELTHEKGKPTHSNCLTPCSSLWILGVRPVHTPRIYRTTNPESIFVGNTICPGGKPPLVDENLPESHPPKSRLLERGLAVRSLAVVPLVLLSLLLLVR